MDWTTTDQPAYQPRSLWKSEQIPDLPCIRQATDATAQPDDTRSVPADDCNEVLQAVLRAVAPFPDAKKAVLEAMGPPDPPLAA